VRGALNSLSYWALRRDGKNERQATATLHKQGVAFKNDLLFGYGINFNETPVWQRRGTVLYWGKRQVSVHGEQSRLPSGILLLKLRGER